VSPAAASPDAVSVYAPSSGGGVQSGAAGEGGTSGTRQIMRIRKAKSVVGLKVDLDDTRLKEQYDKYKSKWQRESEQASETDKELRALIREENEMDKYLHKLSWEKRAWEEEREVYIIRTVLRGDWSNLDFPDVQQKFDRAINKMVDDKKKWLDDKMKQAPGPAREEDYYKKKRNELDKR